ncbi:hypothetical protein [Dietzia sp. PP-33]|jgi:hypothetical protein|uniref:hypothetical protein n=1 Tax=Dietzia sp. PP-33 TaxID=2957500 RepID=UPI0029AFD6BF|nr:hypothetical protein [Dietzia sp. PP-33]MDX2355730.1 hypothetical protein [Dietzia sp. PP-33]
MDEAPTLPTESAHTVGLRRAVTLGATALAVLMVLSAGVWWAVDGQPGLWGALLGAAIGGVFVLLTAVVVIATAKTSPQVTGAVLLGTWLLKLIVAIGVVAALKPLDFYSKRAFALTIVVAMVVVLVSETVAVLRNRAPYVEP